MPVRNFLQILLLQREAAQKCVLRPKNQAVVRERAAGLARVKISPDTAAPAPMLARLSISLSLCSSSFSQDFLPPPPSLLQSRDEMTGEGESVALKKRPRPLSGFAEVPPPSSNSDEERIVLPSRVVGADLPEDLAVSRGICRHG